MNQGARFEAGLAHLGARADALGIDSLVIFGSTLESSVRAEDVDVWLEGPESAIQLLVAGGSYFHGLKLDVNHSGCLNAELLDAFRWQASQGRAIVGSVPPRPPLTYDDVVGTFQRAVANSARRVADRASIHAAAGLPTADVLALAALRSALRSHTSEPSGWRAIRRAHPPALAELVSEWDVRAADRVRRGDLIDVRVLDAIHAIASYHADAQSSSDPTSADPFATADRCDHIHVGWDR